MCLQFVFLLYTNLRTRGADVAVSEANANHIIA